MAADVTRRDLYCQIVDLGASYEKSRLKEEVFKLPDAVILEHFEVYENISFYKSLEASEPQELEHFKTGLSLLKEYADFVPEPHSFEFVPAVNQMIDKINHIRDAQLMPGGVTPIPSTRLDAVPAGSGSGGSGTSSATFSLEAGLSNRLEPLLLRAIASYLDVTDFFGKEGFVDEALKYNTLKVTHHDLSNVEMKMEELMSYLNKFRTTEEIVNSSTGVRISRDISSVRTLVIPKNLRSEITDDDLKKIVRLCPNLEFLNLSGCRQITDVSIDYLTQKQEIIQPSGTYKLPRLERLNSLNLSGCIGITGNTFTYLSKLSNLENLDVSLGGNLAGRIRDEHLVPLSKLSNLRRLNLNGNTSSLTDTGLEHIAKLENLTHLSAMGINRNFTGEGLNKLITELNKLTYLNLAGWKLLKDEDMPLFAKARNLTNLVLGANKLLTYNALRPLHLIPNLTDLALIYLKNVLTRKPEIITVRPIPLVIEYLSRCSKLERLNVYESFQNVITGINAYQENPNLFFLKDLREYFRNVSNSEIRVKGRIDVFKAN